MASGDHQGHDRDCAPGDDLARDFWARPAPVPPGLAPHIGTPPDAAEFRLLADHIPTLCWIANRDGFIVWYNQRWHDYCGTTAAEMEGWGWQKVHDPVILPAVMASWTAAIAAAKPFEMTFPLRGADGVFRPFLTRVKPVRDDAGTVVRWVGVNTEVAAQVAAETALRVERDRGRGVFDAIDAGLLVLDRAFRVIDINAAALAMNRTDAATVLGRTHWDNWPGTEDGPQGQLFREVMATRIAGKLSFSFTWAHGHTAWVEVRVFPRSTANTG